ncbi:unnamed protein product [Ectocarpus sp. 4 AP-2014]
MTSPPQQQVQRMDRGSFVSSESFESLTCGAPPVVIERLRQATGADAGPDALKELGESIKKAAVEKLGGSGDKGGVEVAFGGAMGRSFYATADGSTTTADVVLFYTLDPLDIDTKQSTCVRKARTGCELSADEVMQALYKLQPCGGGASSSSGSGGATASTS